MAAVATELTVYNLPFSTTEDEVYSIFPSVKSVNMIRSQSVPSRSRGMCILQFNNPRDCKQAYDECVHGKEVDGRMLRAEYGSSRRNSLESAHRVSENYSHSRPTQDYYNQQNHGGFSAASSGDANCTLTISNLPYSASEEEILHEFPQALRVALSLDEQGRSKGVAQVTFSTSDQCSAALNSCNHKTMGGRPMRGRIQRDSDGGQSNNQRSYGNREYNTQRDNYQREYNNPRDHGQRDFNNSREQSNQSGNRQGARQYDYNSGKSGARDNRFHGSSGAAGSFSNRQGPRDFDRNDRSDRSDNRRDRSPARNEPIRGYGSSKGPRITSAVIHRPPYGEVSDSSSSSDE